MLGIIDTSRAVKLLLSQKLPAHSYARGHVRQSFHASYSMLFVYVIPKPYGHLPFSHHCIWVLAHKRAWRWAKEGATYPRPPCCTTKFLQLLAADAMCAANLVCNAVCAADLARSCKVPCLASMRVTVQIVAGVPRQRRSSPGCAQTQRYPHLSVSSLYPFHVKGAV